MGKRYYCSVDIAKLICSLLVVCIHTSPLLSFDGRLNSFLVNCLSRVAVPLFFVFSGFFLFSKIGDGGIDKGIVLGYIKRIFKLYIIWSAVYFPFTLLAMMKAPGVKGAVYVLLNWAKNMVFSAGYGFLWYLPATAVAVAAVSFLINKGAGINRIIALGAVLYIIGLCGQSYAGLADMIPFPQCIRTAAADILRFTVTTRNGIFEGILFIALGARLACKKDLGSCRSAAVAFIASMIGFAAEFAFVSKMNWQLEYDMYLLLVPATYFLAKTVLLADIRVSESAAANARAFSSLIYFTHMLFVEAFSILTPYDNVNSLLAFFIVLVPTICFDTLIIALSRTKKFKFLKNIY